MDRGAAAARRRLPLLFITQHHAPATGAAALRHKPRHKRRMLLLDILLDTLIDAAKMLPFLYFACLLVELAEHRRSARLMKLLSVVGTAAMFMVGGGILTHGIPGAHALIHHWVEAVGAIAAVGGALAVLTPTLIDAVFGVLVGALVLVLVSVAGKAWGALRA